MVISFIRERNFCLLWASTKQSTKNEIKRELKQTYERIKYYKRLCFRIHPRQKRPMKELGTSEKESRRPAAAILLPVSLHSEETF